MAGLILSGRTLKGSQFIQLKTPRPGRKVKLMKHVSGLLSVLALALALWWPGHAAQATEAGVTAAAAEETETDMTYDPESPMEKGKISGAYQYYRLCAVCHGEEGRGDGPMSRMLKRPPANLTQLARNNGGHFPFLRVLAAIDGRNTVEVHGNREMPVWGQLLTKEYDQFVARAIELELLLHLNSLQVR